MMSDLKIDVELVRKLLTGFIRQEVQKVGFEKVVLGLSGGADSSLVAFLAAEALGPENVCGIMMPYKTSSRESIEHAELVVAKTGIHSKLIEIAPMVDAYFEKYATESGNLQRGNKMARERMAILYDHSVQLKALVIGTGNKSELMVGYCTLHGDMACAINPLGDLYKTQVWQLAEAVGVPQEIIGKAPSADLWHGQTDEGELGFTYGDLDQLLYLMVDRRFSNDRLIDCGFDKGFVEQVASMVQNSQFKRKPPIIAKLTRRTVDSDFRYARDWGR